MTLVTTKLHYKALISLQEMWIGNVRDNLSVQSGNRKSFRELLEGDEHHRKSR